MITSPSHAARLVGWALADAGVRLGADAVTAQGRTPGGLAGEGWAADYLAVTLEVKTSGQVQEVTDALGELGITGISLLPGGTRSRRWPRAGVARPGHAACGRVGRAGRGAGGRRACQRRGQRQRGA